MDYFLLSAIRILNLFILTEGYNLVLGYTGMVHVGHIAFMAIGAYTSALLTLSGAPFWVGLVGGVSAAGLAGFILALPTVRFRDDYIVAATLAMTETIRLVLLNEREITGGSTGLPKIQRPELFGINFHSNAALLILVIIITAIVLGFVWRLTHSPFGKVLESIREDEVAAQALGKNVIRVKIQVLVIGALLAGLAGVIEAHTIQFIEPDVFNLQYMTWVFLIVVFGGQGTFFSPIVGSTILYVLFEANRFIDLPPSILGPLRWIIFSTLLIAMILYKPTGIMGKKLVRKKL